MSQQNVLAMRALYDAYNRSDLEAMEKGVSPAIEWNEADNFLYADGNPYKGFPAVRDGIFGRIAQDFDDFQVGIEQLLDAGDTVVATGRYTGKCKETGTQLDDQFCHLLHVNKEGKLDRFQQFADTLHAAEVTGLIKRITGKAKAPAREPLPA